jgi:uncharacterized membrane protein
VSPRRRIRGDDLSTPRRARLSLGVHYDPDAFGEFSETIARTIGTARFLVIQTIIIVLWIFVNAAVPPLEFDEYPFIFLTLALSLQAAYAAPLILLAQNRQADRDRAEAERDRDVNSRTQADTEYLARELASIRLALADIVTTDDLREAVDRVQQTLDAHQDGGGGMQR